METSSVEIESIDSTTLDSNAKVHKKCFFCLKDVIVNKKFDALGKKITGSPAYYCTFCVRNQHYTKRNKHILILNFRGIIGYYYYAFYNLPNSGDNSMYYTELLDFIDLHVNAGLQNPLFTYDYESLCWFVDFSRIGSSRKKVELDDILTTIVEILATFNLTTYLKKLDQAKLYGKYKESIVEFYEKRYRPKDKKICSPTLFDCGVERQIGPALNKVDCKDLSNFTYKNLNY